MTPTTVDAVYRDGVLHPASPLPLPDGTAVRVTVAVPAAPKPPLDPAEVLARILAIAAKHKNAPGAVNDGLVVSENVDKILYGTRGDPGDVR